MRYIWIMSKRVAVTCGDPSRLGPYADALRAVGLEPVPNPPSLDGFDGLMVTGGTDVDPSLYGETPHPKTEAPDETRDALEKRLLREALDGDIPTLCICRGLQMLNVVQGGTLVQHIESEAHEVRSLPREKDVHSIAIRAGSKLAGVAGGTSAQVNSRHHQAVGRVGEGLQVTAVSPDGVVEAMERTDRKFAVAVQWHPEDRIRSSETDRRLFQAFADALG